MILEKEGAFRSSRGNSRFKNGIICHFQQWNCELRLERSEESNGEGSGSASDVVMYTGSVQPFVSCESASLGPFGMTRVN